MLQQLKALEPFDLAGLGHNSPEYIHLLVEAKKAAFEDRDKLVADPNVVPVPIADLLGVNRAETFRDGFDAKRTSDGAVRAVNVQRRTGDTTVVTVVDREGNAVALIQSIFADFGSGIFVDQGGFALQNRMCGFTLEPSHPNALGPGKRPLHTLCCSIITQERRLHTVCATPGGHAQTQTLVQVLNNMTVFGMDPQEAIEAPRFTHQSGRLFLELRLGDATTASLRVRGHEVENLPSSWSDVAGGAAVIVAPSENGACLAAGADPRRDGYAIPAEFPPAVGLSAMNASAPAGGPATGPDSASDREAVVVRVVDLHKLFGDVPVLRGVSFEVGQGEVLTVIGASGSGKSTLLRCLNFLEEPTSGEVYIEGSPIGFRIDDQGVRHSVSQATINRQRTRIGMVFQQFNLWPHMTVIQNLMEAPVHVRRLPRHTAQELACECLEKVNMLDKRDRYPANLSGGEQQRVGIARALAMEPSVMLFDEPTSSLDPELKGEVLSVMLNLASEGTTMLLVTHEITFCRDVSDRVIFLHGGVIEEEGTAEEVLARPQSRQTQQFLYNIR